MNTPSLSSSAQRVQAALNQSGIDFEVIELANSTRTAPEAAQAVGCQVGQIAKSLVFRTGDHKAVLVIASGANRVDEKKVSLHLSQTIHKADANFVREQTGFAIGGVPPVGHLQPLQTLIDEDIMQYSEIWAAAGTPNAIFRLTPEALQQITGGLVVQLRIEP